MVLEFLNPIFDPIFEPLLNLSPFWTIFVIAFFVTLLSSLIYKFTTDQDLMKRLKQEQKDIQKKMRDSKDHPEKMKEHQKEAFQKSMEYMKHSMKPMLFTTLPVLILIGWLGAHLAYFPLQPNEPFAVTVALREPVNISLSTDLEIVSTAGENLTQQWILKGPSGNYILEFSSGEHTVEHTVLITEEQQYVSPLALFPSGIISNILVENREMKPLGNLSFFGWQPGWLGIYILLSLVFNVGIRKLLNIH